MAPAHKALVSAPDDGDILHEITIEGHQVSYLSVIGSLMYAMLGTRPDLAYTVGVLSRYSSAPRASHWVMAKRALRYLKGTANMELRFDGSDVSMDMQFHGYSDADWSSDSDTSRLTSDYVVTYLSVITARSLGLANGRLLSLSHRQNPNTLDSATQVST